MPQTATGLASATDGSSRSNLLLIVTAAVVCAALALVRLCSGHLGHDQMLLLLDAQRWLSGETLYGPRLSETNPPVGIWFSALPVLLARVTPLGIETAFRGLLVILIAVSVAWCARILRGSVLGTNRVAVALTTSGLLAIELFLAQVDFGQREQLMILCCLPLILRLALATDAPLSLLERCGLGAATSLGVWFKPQDVLVLVVLLAAVCVRKRSLRPCLSPEIIAWVVSCFVLLAIVRLCAPFYFSDTLPILRDTYWALGTDNALPLLVAERKFATAAVVALVACVLLRSRLADAGGSILLLLSSFGALLACVLQHTTWRYHQYPHRALLLIAVTYTLVQLAAGALRHTSPARLTLVLGALALAVAALLIANRRESPPDKRVEYLALDQYFSQLSPQTKVYVFSTEVRDEATALDHHLVWGSRFAHLWMLPAIIKNQPGMRLSGEPFKQLAPARLAVLSKIQRQEIAQDLRAWQPEVVLVRHCTPADSCQGLSKRSFAFLPWFQQDPHFAQEWTHYEPQSPIDGYDVFRRVR